MADLTEIQAAGTTKVVGSDATGAEQAPVQSTASGALHINIRDSAGADLSTVLALDATLQTQNTITGSVTEVPPVSDTSPSGLNGRLQRIAQRLSSLISLLPVSLGQKTKSNSLAVVLSADATYSSACVNFQTSTVGTAQVAADLSLVYTDLMNVPVTSSLHPLAFGAGEVLSPGVYNIAGAATIAGSLTLNGGGDSNALYIIKATGAFNVAASATVTLVNGATSKNVFWVAEGAVGIGDTVTMQGTVLSHGAAVAVGTGCTMSGRLLTTGGAVSFGPGTLSVPAGTSLINLRTVAYFCDFTSSGGVSNSGTSSFNGSIGTNLGAITGFGTSTITNGRIFQAGESQPLAAVTDIFSIAGSASKTIKVTKVGFSGIQTTSSTVDILLIKRSTASSTDGATSAVKVSMDSSNPSPTAQVYSREVSPTTLGTVAGVLRSAKVDVSAGAAAVDFIVFDFSSNPAQSVTLRGVGENLNINTNGAFLPGGKFNMYVEWMEE